MSTTPSAAELHTLVNGEFTMPDGTKRQALWERVPETQWGHATGGLFNLSNGEQCPAGWWFNMLHIPDDMAAALIRVQIEDWLGDVWIKQPDASLGGTRVVQVNPHERSRSDFGDEYGGQTVLHALVTAAHTVADTLGIVH